MGELTAPILYDYEEKSFIYTIVISMKLVSVVIPTYKRPDMVSRAIKSVLAQTYSNIEIIVVDDNNPQTEERFYTEYAMREFDDVPNVRYIRHDRNKNGSAARNTGWRAACGEYITFLDDDDEISPNKIKAQVDCLESLDESWGACYTAYHILMKNGTVQYSATSQSGDVYLRTLMRTFYMGSGSNVLLRKSVVDEIGGYDETFRRNQDIEFMARAFEHYKVAYIAKDLLTIHFEVRAIKRTFEFLDSQSVNYVEKFSARINSLSIRDRHRVLSVISLDRARVACKHKEFMAAKRILKENGVTILEICKYLLYLINRYKTKKSYGFYLE